MEGRRGQVYDHSDVDEPWVYKWMANILVPSRMRGLYLKPLEYISPDAKVPFQRVVAAMLVSAAAVLGAVVYVSDAQAKAPYVAAPIACAVACVLAMAVVYLLSSRNRSMLQAVAEYNAFKLIEARRSRSNLRLGSLGIDGVGADGTVRFEGGDLGAVYDVRGQISESTLPRVANAVAHARMAYYVARTPTSQELRITSIEPNLMESQLADFDRIADLRGRSADPRDRWVAELARQHRVAMEHVMAAGNQMTMVQTVVLRDETAEALAQSCRQFERACAAGMYARASRICSPEAVEGRLGGCVLRSEGGA